MKTFFKMIIFISKCIFFVMLIVKNVHCQDRHCKNMIQVFKENDNYYAKITVPMPLNHNNVLKLNVQFDIVNSNLQNWNNKLQFIGTIDDIENNLPLAYKLEYPTADILSKITYTGISINNQVLCIAEHQKGFGQISTVNLRSTTAISNFDNSNKNNANLHGGNNNNNIPNVIIPAKPPNSIYTNPSSNINSNSQNYYPVPSRFSPDQSSSVVPSISRKTENRFDSCGKTEMSSSKLIANGNNASMGAYPWIGALFLRESSANPEFLCGASLITKKLALTAGHCIGTYSNPEYYLIFGRNGVHDWLDENDQKVKVDKAIRHPDYTDETSDADLGILQFSKEVTYTATVKPVCLWDANTLSQSIINEIGVVVGWGNNENNQLEQSLQELYIRVISNEECRRSSSEFNEVISDRTFCAGNNTKAGPCNGDSGGGFYFFVNGRWTIRGIVSRSLRNLSGRCDFSKYAVYLDVSKHMEWIRQFL